MPAQQSERPNVFQVQLPEDAKDILNSQSTGSPSTSDSLPPLLSKYGYKITSDHPFACGRFAGHSLKCAKIIPQQQVTDLPDYLLSELRTIVLLPPYPAPVPTLSRHSEDLISRSNETRVPSDERTYLTTYSNRELPTANFRWMKLSDVLEGQKVLTVWQRLAAERIVFECEGRDCNELVHAWAETSGLRLEGLATCEVLLTEQRHVTPPTRCEPIALKMHDQWFIVGAYRLEYMFYNYAGRPDFVIALHYLDWNNGSQVPNKIVQAMMRALSSQPLALRVSSTADGEIVGVADYRFDRALQQFILVTVRIKFSAPALLGRIQVDPKVTVASTLYVSRQNSSTNSDWHLPSDQENAAYVDRLRDNVHQQLDGLCDTPHWQQSEGMIAEFSCH
ncbi:hypothetical protein [Tunturiibacter gelidiferens]|uniref:hypothetical protein n=1 Tax=Tunturiibacter gelidiferens TaxID=3069689 RepID=UPI003D9B9D78